MRTLFVVFLYASATLLLCAQTAHAWWCFGHMATATVAKSQMTQATIAYVESVVGSLAAMGPFPTTPDMTQVACWADELKDPIMLKMMGDWHFIDQVYGMDGYIVPPGADHLQNEGVVKVISQFYQSIKANKQNPSGWAMGFSVANLIHFIGDVHQPLHAVEMFNTEYPTGDNGGNYEIVTIEGQTRNLHMIWDSVCWKWANDLDRPLSPAGHKTVDDYAQYLLDTYSFTEKQIGTYDPQTFADESFELAKTAVYPGIVNNTAISQAYLDKCMPVAEGRVTLGGLRLGRQLQKLLGSYAEQWYAENKVEFVLKKRARHHSGRRRHGHRKDASLAAPPAIIAEDAAADSEELPPLPPVQHDEATLNRTAEALSHMKKGFETSLRLRAKEMKVSHLKRKSI